MKKNSIITLIIGIVIGVLITTVVSFSINSNSTPASTSTTTATTSEVSTTECEETTEAIPTDVEEEKDELIWLNPSLYSSDPTTSDIIVVSSWDYEDLSDPHTVYLMHRKFLNIDFLELDPESSWKLIEKELIAPGLIKVVVQSTFPEEGTSSYISTESCDLLYGGEKIAEFYYSNG